MNNLNTYSSPTEQTQDDTVVLKVQGLTKSFTKKSGLFFQSPAKVHAVDDVSFAIAAGETLGLVGESGCGKSTVGKCLLNLITPDDGQINYRNQDISKLNSGDMRALRRELQIVFQDPYESLNSRHTIGQILEEPLIIHRWGNAEKRQQRVAELLQRVGLNADAVDRFPHEFSGGQRQRIGIARAIALEPQFLVLDEAVSALDVSIQSQIINLLLELQRELNLAMLFIAHDLAVVRHVSDRVAVMYLGQIVEVANSDDIYKNAKHPYTQALISAIPIPDPTVERAHKPLEGEVPNPINPPSGCRFHTRCPRTTDLCKTQVPAVESVDSSSDHQVSCHHWR